MSDKLNIIQCLMCLWHCLKNLPQMLNSRDLLTVRQQYRLHSIYNNHLHSLHIYPCAFMQVCPLICPQCAFHLELVETALTCPV